MTHLWQLLLIGVVAALLVAGLHAAAGSGD